VRTAVCEHFNFLLAYDARPTPATISLPLQLIDQRITWGPGFAEPTVDINIGLGLSASETFLHVVMPTCLGVMHLLRVAHFW